MTTQPASEQDERNQEQVGDLQLSATTVEPVGRTSDPLTTICTQPRREIQEGRDCGRDSMEHGDNVGVCCADKCPLPRSGWGKPGQRCAV